MMVIEMIIRNSGKQTMGIQYTNTAGAGGCSRYPVLRQRLTFKRTG